MTGYESVKLLNEMQQLLEEQHRDNLDHLFEIVKVFVEKNIVNGTPTGKRLTKRLPEIKAAFKTARSYLLPDVERLVRILEETAVEKIEKC